MKKIMLSWLIVLFGLISYGQNRALDEIYDKYQDDCLSIDINVPNWIKKAVVDDIDEPGTREAIRKAKRFKLLIVDDRSDWPADFKRVKRSLVRDDFDELITIRDDGELSLYFNENRDELGLRELIFFINGEDHDGILLSLKGEFSKRDIEAIIDDIHIECN